VRATAAVLADVVREARHELLLMTYSAKPHQPLRDALGAAMSRGVAVSVVVETLQGAGSALSGHEPYQAFTGVPGLELWHWPASKRTEPGAKMHAKLAVADRRVLLVTSANLTQSGVAKNIEAGLLSAAARRCPPIERQANPARLIAAGAPGRGGIDDETGVGWCGHGRISPPVAIRLLVNSSHSARCAPRSPGSAEHAPRRRYRR
jgi:hypothetical protein